MSVTWRIKKPRGKRPRKVFYYEFLSKGKKYFSGPYETIVEAKQAEAQRREELKHPAKTPTDISFLDAFNKFLDHCTARGQTQKWIDHRAYVVSAFYSDWYTLPIKDITTGMVVERVDQRSAKVSGQTANSDLKILKTFFNFCGPGTSKAKGMEWIPHNPCDGINKYTTIEKRPPTPYTKEEFNKLLLAATSEERAYLNCLKHATARVSQINQLEWEHVHLEDDYLNSYLLKYTRKKRGGLRFSRVDMNQVLHRELMFMHARKQPADKYVFVNRDSNNDRFWDRRRMLLRVCKKAAVKYSGFHAIRHHVASVLAERTTNIKAISLAMEHQDPQVTARYLHKLGIGRDDTFDLIVDGEDQSTGEETDEKNG